MKSRDGIGLVLCGFVAGVVWNLISVLFLSTLSPDFVASVQTSAPHPARGGAFFFALDVAMGIWAVWLYSAIAPRYGPRPLTVAIAGTAWWSLKTLQSAKWAGLGFVDAGPNLLPVGAATLASAVVALAIGAWLYNKISESSPRNVTAL